MADNKPTFEAVRVIAGFIAFIIGCSPTAMRLGSVPLEKLVHAEAALLDEQGVLELAPAILGGRTLSELLADGSVEVTIDEKFPQAFGIAGVIENPNSFASFSWELLHNRYAEKTPFVTSDFPAAIERNIDPLIANRVVPLRSDFAVRIYPQLRPEGRPDLPTDFRYKIHYPSPSEIIAISRTIVRNAEKLVFSSVDTPALRSSIKRNARFHLELDHQTVPTTTGRFLLNRMVVRERSAV